MRNYQKILILVLYWWSIRIFFLFFEAYLREKEIVFQNNVAEKYYKIGRSELG